MKTVILITTSTCGPCKIYKPVLQKFCEDNSLALEIVTDPAREIIDKYGLSKVPTTIIQDGGEVVNKFTTALTEKELNQVIGIS